MERRDWLWPGGPVFYYDTDLFRPGTDAFLLGAFARPRAGDAVCDLGAGTGLVGLLLLVRQPDLTVHGVELQEAAVRLAERTARENGLPMANHLADLRRLEGVLEAGSFDYAVSNPPYFAAGRGRPAGTVPRRTAREERSCTLEELCAASARLLRWGGRLALVYRPERLCDLFCALREHALEPKRLRLVQHSARSAPSLALVEARRGGKPGLTAEPVLLLRDGDGQETPEARAIYFR